MLSIHLYRGAGISAESFNKEGKKQKNENPHRGGKGGFGSVGKRNVSLPPPPGAYFRGGIKAPTSESGVPEKG